MCEIPDYLPFSVLVLRAGQTHRLMDSSDTYWSIFLLGPPFSVRNNKMLMCFQWNLGVKRNLPQNSTPVKLLKLEALFFYEISGSTY